MAPKPVSSRTGKGKQEDGNPINQPKGSLLHSLYVVFAESGKTPLNGREALSRIFEKRLMVPPNHTGRMQERSRKAHRNLELENEAIKRLRKSSYFFELTRGSFMLCSALEAPDGGNDSQKSVPQDVIDEQNSSFNRKEPGRSRKRKSESPLKEVQHASLKKSAHQPDKKSRVSAPDIEADIDVSGQQPAYGPGKKSRLAATDLDDDSDSDFEKMVLRQVPCTDYLPTHSSKPPTTSTFGTGGLDTLSKSGDQLCKPKLSPVIHSVVESAPKVSTTTAIIPAPIIAGQACQAGSVPTPQQDSSAEQNTPSVTVPDRRSKPHVSRRRSTLLNWQAALSVRQAAFTKRQAFANRYASKGAELHKEDSFSPGPSALSEGRKSYRLAAKLASLRLAQSLKQGELARIVQTNEDEDLDSPVNHQDPARLPISSQALAMKNWAPTSEPWKHRRCSRSVKESWQCNREAAVGHKLCEHHLYVNYYRKKFAGYRRGSTSKTKGAAAERGSAHVVKDPSKSVVPNFASGQRPSGQLGASTTRGTAQGQQPSGKQTLVLPCSSLPKNFSDGTSDGEKLSKKENVSARRVTASPNPPKDSMYKKPRQSPSDRGKQVTVSVGSDFPKDSGSTAEKQQSSRHGPGKAHRKNIGMKHHESSVGPVSLPSADNISLSSPLPVPGSVIDRIFLKPQKHLPQPNHISSCDNGGRLLLSREVKGSPPRIQPQGQQDSSAKSLYSYLLKYRLVKQQVKKARSNGVDFAETDFARSLPSNFQIGLKSDISEITGLLEKASNSQAPPPSRPTCSSKVQEVIKCKLASAPIDLHQTLRKHDMEPNAVQLGDNLGTERGPSNPSKGSPNVCEEARKYASRKRLASGFPKNIGSHPATRVSASSEEMPVSSDSNGSVLRNLRKCSHARKLFVPRSLDQQTLEREGNGAGFQIFCFPKGLMDYLRVKKGHGGSQVCTVPKSLSDGDRKFRARNRNVRDMDESRESFAQLDYPGESTVAQYSKLCDDRQAVICAVRAISVEKPVANFLEKQDLSGDKPSGKLSGEQESYHSDGEPLVADDGEVRIDNVIAPLRPSSAEPVSAQVQCGEGDGTGAESVAVCHTGANIMDAKRVCLSGLAKESSMDNQVSFQTAPMEALVGDACSKDLYGKSLAQVVELRTRPLMSNVQTLEGSVSNNNNVQPLPLELCSTHISFEPAYGGEAYEKATEPLCEENHKGSHIEGRCKQKTVEWSEAGHSKSSNGSEGWFHERKDSRHAEEIPFFHFLDVNTTSDPSRSQVNGALVPTDRGGVDVDNGEVQVSSSITGCKTLWDFGKESDPMSLEKANLDSAGLFVVRHERLQGHRETIQELQPHWLGGWQEISRASEPAAKYPMNMSTIEAVIRNGGMQPNFLAGKLIYQGTDAASALNKVLPGKHMLQAQPSSSQIESEKWKRLFRRSQS